MQLPRYDKNSVNIGQLLDIVADQFGDRPFLNYQESNVNQTYGQVQKISNDAAKGFMSLGIKKGDHVAVWANNIPEWIYAKFAIAKAGGVVVTVNTSLRCFEMEYLVRQSDATTLVMVGGVREDDEYLKIIENLCPELKTSSPGKLNSRLFPRLKNIVLLDNEDYPGMVTWKKLIRQGGQIKDEALKIRQDSVFPEDVVNILYTSGTTGSPKGVMLSHKNIIGNAHSLADNLELSNSDRVCVPVPFFHCFGCVAGILTSLVSGSTLCPIPSFSPREVLETVQELQCTVLHGVSTMFLAEIEAMTTKKYDTSSLRTGIIAGATVTPNLMQQIETLMGIPELSIAYGQTESSPAITATNRKDSIEKRFETVGRPLPGVEVKVVKPSGGEVPSGSQGELCVRGDNVMKGYYKKPEATRTAIDDSGWLHTGDLGRLDEQGYCIITGRVKEVIIRGGENIYPVEIETFLLTHPDIMDVHVVGVPDEKYGEQVHAFVKLPPHKFISEKELKAYCKNKIAFHKIPTRFVFTREYPTTASGKVQKFKLVEQILGEM
ncbi:fatty-acyl-CoA synthase [Desulfocicer vacuolatum DSM 3385]|uniref:Fatty-acyl-CoA synthase n=1 Tax=Desulfocicer vacuolatum DSM 3385 TaxID=1121400 RepID=A0A1W2BHZ1_9BACT|nr:AMP-binding protein [Desulfocicer vacuolatum]SMC72553.1 fatty-acyl-CoA synthase [Desulfocicer vacuolatum DSM 3385]